MSDGEPKKDKEDEVPTKSVDDRSTYRGFALDKDLDKAMDKALFKKEKDDFEPLLPLPGVVLLKYPDEKSTKAFRDLLLSAKEKTAKVTEPIDLNDLIIRPSGKPGPSIRISHPNGDYAVAVGGKVNEAVVGGMKLVFRGNQWTTAGKDELLVGMPLSGKVTADQNTRDISIEYNNGARMVFRQSGRNTLYLGSGDNARFTDGVATDIRIGNLRLKSQDGKTWRNADTNAVFDGEIKISLRRGTVSVTENGRTTEHPQTVVERLDGSKVFKNKQEQVTMIRHASGLEVKFENGKPVEVVTKSDGTYLKENDKWYHVKDGKKTPTTSDVTVEEDGTVVIFGRGKEFLETMTYKPDGSKVYPGVVYGKYGDISVQITENKEGTQFYRRSGFLLKGEKEGELLAIQQPNGNYLSFEKGQLKAVHTSEGKWTEHNGKWSYLGKKENENTPAPFRMPRQTDAKVSVDDAGNLTIEENKQKTITKADGTTECIRPDGVKDVYDTRNLLTKTEYPNGAVESFTYHKVISFPKGEKWVLDSQQLKEGEGSVERDDKGRPTKVTYPNGRTRGVAYDSEGRATITDTDGKKHAGTVELDGTIRFAGPTIKQDLVWVGGDKSNEGAKSEYTFRPDGTYSLISKNPDGLNDFEVRGKHERPFEIQNKSGVMTIRYGKNGQVEQILLNGDDIKAGANWKIYASRDGQIDVNHFVGNKLLSTAEFHPDGVSKRFYEGGSKTREYAVSTKTEFHSLSQLNAKLGKFTGDRLFREAPMWSRSDIDTLMKHMNPTNALRLREMAGFMPEKLRQETLKEMTELLQKGTVSEKLSAVQILGALGKFATPEQVKALSQFQGEEGLRKLRAAGMNDTEAQEFQRHAGRSLLRMLGPGATGDAAALALEKPWPGLEDALIRRQLVAYAKGDIGALERNEQAQKLAYEVGVTPPLSQVLKNLGVPGSPQELREKADKLVANYGVERVQQILTRAAQINALPPHLRKELTGSEEAIDIKKTIGQLANKTMDANHPSSNPLYKDVTKWLHDREESAEKQLKDAAKLLLESQENSRKNIKDLAYQTKKDAISLWNHITSAFGDKKIDEFQQMQKQYLDKVPPLEEQQKLLAKLVNNRQLDLDAVRLAIDAGRQAAYSQQDQRAADRYLLWTVAMNRRDVMEVLTPDLLKQAKLALDRQSAIGDANAKGLPDFSGPDGYKKALESLTQLKSYDKDNLKYSDYRLREKEAFEALIKSPPFTKMQDISAVIGENASTFFSLMQAGLEGSRFKEYIAFVKDKANILKEALEPSTPESKAQRDKDLKEMRQLVSDMKEALTKVNSDEYHVRRLLEEKIKAAEGMLELIDPEAKSPKRAQFLQAIDTVLNTDKFDESTARNWIVKEGPVVLASMAAATAIIVLTAGAGTPIVIAGLAGAVVVGMTAGELVKEGQFWIGLRKEGSLVGEWARSRQVIDEKSGLQRDMELLKDVVPTYLQHAAVDFAILVATLGIGKGLSSIINSMGKEAFAAFLSKNAAELATAVRSLREAEAALIKAGLKDRTFAQEFCRQFLGMGGFGAAQELGVDALKGLVGGDSKILLPLLVGSLLVAAHGIKFRPMRNNKIVIDMEPTHPEFSKVQDLITKHMQSLKADGNTVTETKTGYKVQTYNGNVVEFQFSSRVAARLGGAIEAERVRPIVGEPAQAELADFKKNIPELSSKALIEYNRLVEDLQHKWSTQDTATDLQRSRQLGKEAAAAKEQIMDQLRQEHPRADAARLEELFRERVKQAEAKSDHPLHTAAKEFSTKSAEQAQLNAKLEKLATERAAELQQKLNEFCDNNNLPRVTVDAGSVPGKSGQYEWGSGKVTVDRHALLSGAALDRIAFHELVHVAQDKALLNLALHRAKGDLGKAATEYELLTGRKPDAEFLRRVEKAKQWEAPPANEPRLNALAESVKSNSTQVSAKYAELAAQERVLQAKVDALLEDAGGKSLERLFGELKDPNSDLHKTLFPDGMPENIKKMFDKWQRDGKLDPSERSKTLNLLVEHLGSRQSTVASAIEKLVTAYAKTATESEAWTGESDAHYKKALDTPEAIADAIKHAKTYAQLQEQLLRAAEHSNNPAIKEAAKERLAAELKDANPQKLAELADWVKELNLKAELGPALKERALAEIESNLNGFFKDAAGVENLRQLIDKLDLAHDRGVQDAVARRLSAEMKDNQDLFKTPEVIDNIRSLIQELYLAQNEGLRTATAERLTREIGRAEPRDFQRLQDLLNDLKLDETKSLLRLNNFEEGLIEKLKGIKNSDAQNAMADEALLTDAVSQRKAIKEIREATKNTKLLDGISDQQILDVLQKDARIKLAKRAVDEAIRDAQINSKDILNKPEELHKVVEKLRQAFAADPELSKLKNEDIAAALLQNARAQQLRDAVYNRVQIELTDNPGANMAELGKLCDAVGDARGKNALRYYEIHQEVYQGRFIDGVKLSDKLLRDLKKIEELRGRYGRAPISDSEFETNLCRAFGFKFGKGTTHRTPIVTSDGLVLRYYNAGNPIPIEPAVSIQSQGIKPPYQRNWLDALEQLTLRGKR